MKRTGQKGVAVVEFALILPLLLVMTFVITEFGRAIYQYNILTKSVRDAARYLSVQTPGTHATEAGNLIVYGNTGGSGPALATGLTTSHVLPPVWSQAGSGPVINIVTVGVSGYQFRSIFASAFGLPLGTVTFSNIQATMRSSS